MRASIVLLKVSSNVSSKDILKKVTYNIASPVLSRIYRHLVKDSFNLLHQIIYILNFKPHFF